MPKWNGRRCVWNDSLQRWISSRTGKQYTAAQYEKLCETGRIAAATYKALAAFMQSDEYQAEQADMVRRLSESGGQMMRLPGQSDRDYLYHVAMTRRGPADLKITRGGSGNGNDGSR
jgi:hypothetical protein